MLFFLKGFDPLVFLSIDTSLLSPEEKESLQKDLDEKMGQYVLLKLSNKLTPEQQSELLSVEEGKDIIKKLQSYLPDAETQVLQELESFKKEYQLQPQ